MTEERLMDTWGRVEVAWREALEAAMTRQREYDCRMTNHLVYHLAGPDLQELEEIAGLWRTALEKRQEADAFIREHSKQDGIPATDSEA